MVLQCDRNRGSRLFLPPPGGNMAIMKRTFLMKIWSSDPLRSQTYLFSNRNLRREITCCVL